MASKRPPETSTLAAEEARVARIVREGVEEAILEMERVVTRYIAEGRADRLQVQQITQMVTALENIAREYGVEIAKPGGELAKLMTAVRAKGATDALGVEAGKAWLGDNKSALDIALFNDAVKIKGALTESVARIIEIIATARLAGRSRAETVKEIQERMTDVGKMTKARAETIYRGETFSGYRQFSTRAAEDNGIEFFQMTGVVDSRTTDLCLSHVGEIKTRAEWEQIEPLVMSYGLHYNCRHSWRPVRNPNATLPRQTEELYRGKVKKQEAIREQEKAA